MAHSVVVVSLVVNTLETVGLGATAWETHSVALRAQTAANTCDLAVTALLLVGVLSSARGPDETHPLGYGRERFFWSLVAALGLLVGGGGVAIDEAIRSAINPSSVHSYALAYCVLGVTTLLELYILKVGLRPIRAAAALRGLPVRTVIRRSTDPSSVAVVVGGVSAVIGSVIAAGGLVVDQATGNPTSDTIACALIGLLLIVASVLLSEFNRDLLSGRGVSTSMLANMRDIVSSQPGVVDVPDLFAVVVGQLSVVVAGDVIFSKEFDVGSVEQAIANAIEQLRHRFPSIQYVYLTPVSEERSRKGNRTGN